MTNLAPDSFQADALEANRRGELSEAQRRGFGALAGSNRRSAVGSAALLLAGAFVVAFLSSPTASPVLRTLVPIACVAIAAFLLVRSIGGSDALSRDLKQGQVQSVEGAIGKRRGGGGGGRSVSVYFLEVGDRTFKVARDTYAAAPDAGFVRLYFLPRSRKIVNLERLANPAPPLEPTPQAVAASLGAALRAHDMRERNEARAGLSGLADALQAGFPRSPEAPPASERDPRPLREAIVGSWSNPMIRVSFSADGGVTTRMMGATRTGHWSVDEAGRLRSDITGRPESADAWVAGNQLTIAAEAGALTFTRESAG